MANVSGQSLTTSCFSQSKLDNQKQDDLSQLITGFCIYTVGGCGMTLLTYTRFLKNRPHANCSTLVGKSGPSRLLDHFAFGLIVFFVN